jgi:hypothetical protein
MARINDDGTNPDVLKLKCWDLYAAAVEQAQQLATDDGDTSLASTLRAVAQIMRSKQRAAAQAAGEPWASMP